MNNIFSEKNLGVSLPKGILRLIVLFAIVIAAFLLILTLAWSTPISNLKTIYILFYINQ